MKHRRSARELVLKMLYACEIGETAGWELQLQESAGRDKCPQEAQDYARKLGRKTIENQREIDEVLQKHTDNWELKRLCAIDRNILRMAVCELLFFQEVPFRVVIDEAVEIAKRFGTGDSGKFVNGVIDSIYRSREMTPTSPSH